MLLSPDFYRIIFALKKKKAENYAMDKENIRHGTRT